MEQQHTSIANYEKKITKKELNKVIKDEVTRMNGRTGNVRLFFEVKEYSIELTKKQYNQIIHDMDYDGKELHKSYDDNNEGVQIDMFSSEDKSLKTRIIIHG